MDTTTLLGDQNQLSVDYNSCHHKARSLCSGARSAPAGTRSRAGRNQQSAPQQCVAATGAADQQSPAAIQRGERPERLQQAVWLALGREVQGDAGDLLLRE